jgi:serine/threonine-protein kinase HipA
VKDRQLATAINIDEDTTASIELAIAAADEFLLSRDKARAIAGEVASSIASWHSDAASLGISVGEIDRMESAFEHSDADLARRWV